jgi:hypothetical protein
MAHDPATRLESADMSNLPMQIVEMLGQTMAKVVPVTIAPALLFSVLAHFWACNPGKPWWRKRELVTDLCHWFQVPLFGIFRLPEGRLPDHCGIDEHSSFPTEITGQLAHLLSVPK